MSQQEVCHICVFLSAYYLSEGSCGITYLEHRSAVASTENVRPTNPAIFSNERHTSKPRKNVARGRAGTILQPHEKQPCMECMEHIQSALRCGVDRLAT